MKRLKKVLPAEQLGIVRVLLIDEDFGSIHTATSRLRSLGCNVTTSRDVSDAIAKMRSLTFDLIVCDEAEKICSPILVQFSTIEPKPLFVVTTKKSALNSQFPTGAIGVIPKFFKADSLLELVSPFKPDNAFVTEAKTK